MGGFTTVCAMPNTNPVTDNAIMIEYALSPTEMYDKCTSYWSNNKGQKSENC